MSSKLLLSDLAPAVIFAIFIYCDIYSVVSTGQTCRYLHQLAFDKSVWLALLDNLQRRSILDRTRTSTIETLSVDEMVGLVKRLVTGPETWSPLDSDSVATVSTEIRLHPTIRNGPGVDYWENVAKLLPSGRHVLFKNQNQLECWNVADDKMIWKHVSGVAEAVVLEFAAEETHRGASLNIMICTCSYNGGRRESYVEFFTLDLQTGSSENLFIARAPGARNNDSYSHASIRGGLAAVGFMAWNAIFSEFMIFNWREKSYFFLQCRENLLLQLKLIREHIIFKTTPANDVNDQIHIIANDALAPYWLPTLDIGAALEFSSVPAEGIPKLDTFVDPDAPRSFMDIYVHESPIRDDVYRVWIRGTPNATNDSEMLLRYQLSLPIDAEPQWCRRGGSSQMAPSYRIIPYSGHTLRWHTTPETETPPDVYTMCPPTSSAPRARVEDTFCGDYLDVAPYSGAITHCTRSSIVIKYYA